MQDAADKQTTQTENNIYRSYNYVGTKETVAYILNDFSNSFNLGASNGEKYFLEVVRIDLGINAIAGIFTGVWDVVNDAVISAVVDNTRTRIGKFRPYLLLMQIPLSFFGAAVLDDPVSFSRNKLLSSAENHFLLRLFRDSGNGGHLHRRRQSGIYEHHYAEPQ